jgi:hypothetical protein
VRRRQQGVCTTSCGCLLVSVVYLCVLGAELSLFWGRSGVCILCVSVRLWCDSWCRVCLSVCVAGCAAALRFWLLWRLFRRQLALLCLLGNECNQWWGTSSSNSSSMPAPCSLSNKSKRWWCARATKVCWERAGEAGRLVSYVSAHAARHVCDSASVRTAGRAQWRAEQ